MEETMTKEMRGKSKAKASNDGKHKKRERTTSRKSKTGLAMDQVKLKMVQDIVDSIIGEPVNDPPKAVEVEQVPEAQKPEVDESEKLTNASAPSDMFYSLHLLADTILGDAEAER